MKKEKLKKMTGLLLTSALLLCMTGCGGTDAPSSASGSAESKSSAESSAPETETETGSESAGAEAESGDTQKLTIAIVQSPNVENYDTNYLTTKIEEDLNVDIEFDILPADANDAKTKLSVQANGGGEMPDIIMMGLTSTEIVQYGQAGVFIDLKDYIADSSLMPNLNAIREEHPEDMETIMKAITSPDGGVYSLFDWRPEDWNQTPFRCWINKTWLENLHLDMPATTEEFKAVMEAFATQDPNGNGIQDEIALTGSNALWGGYTPNFLINSFVFYNGGLALDEKDGSTVIAPFISDGWRDALAYMNELCEMGALDPAMFTMDATMCQGLLDQDPNVVGCVCAGGWGYWNGGLDSENFKEFDLLGPLKGPEGVAYGLQYTYSPGRIFFVTRSCEDPELAMAVGDWFYQLEHSLIPRYGEEGVDWSIDEADTSTRTALYASEGYECKIAILDNIWGSVQNKMWQGVGPQYVHADFFRGRDSLAKGDDTRDGDFRAKGYALYGDAHPALLPELMYTQEEVEAIAEIQTNIMSYVDGQLAEFVTGNRSLDEWDQYLADIEAMGLQEWLDVAQQAYDRMK